MIWTENDTTVHAHPVAAGSPLIDRRKNTAIFSISKDQALGLVAEIAQAFGVDGVPSGASFDRINVVVEGAMFFPREME